MKKVSYIVAVLFLLIITVCSSCTNRERESRQGDKDPGKLKVYTTIFPLYDFAINVGGDAAEVQYLVPPGVEPHEWEPAPRDLAKLGEGNVFIYCGAGLESWVEKALNNINNPDLVVVDTSKGIDLFYMDHGDSAHNPLKTGIEMVDPHIWLDPVNAKQMVNNIKEGMCKADPGNREYYEANAAGYNAKLANLHQDYILSLRNTPVKSFITSHDAFGYLARRYGLEQIPLRGISPEVEPTPARMAEIVKIARGRDIKYIFFESMVNPKVSEVIASEVGAEVLVLNPLGGLARDEIDAGKSYLSVMRDNLNNLQLALGVKYEL